jgi:3-oxoadipate enol-lactonase
VRRTWAPQLADLSDRWLCVAVDLHGHGESRAPSKTISIDAFADDVAALLEHLDAGPGHVCGLSMGGIVALRLSSRCPALVRSLVLADAWAFHPEAAAGLARRLTAIDSMPLDRLAQQRMPQVLATHAPAEMLERAIADMAGKDPAAYRRSNEVLWAADLRAEAVAVAAPALVVVGELDRVAPPALSIELAALIPGARLRLIPDAGHLSNEENAVVFNRVVREFLEAVDA